MRGLTGAGPVRARTTTRAATTATAVLAAVALSAAGCGTGGTGARDEGPAHTDPVASAPAAAASAEPSRTPDRVDAVRLVKADPEVSAEVKRELKPCVADQYPVDVSYGNLTRGSVDDVVVNVLTCGDAVGVGSYVYREQGGAYVNVFSAEEPPLYAEIDGGDLVVTKQVYARKDQVSNPSGDDVITYRWESDRFTEKYRTHNDYGQVSGTKPVPAPDS
ncbi:hypothetical protein [Streptomyces sp. SAI-229]|uniref:hypothetical protein n=1 Tax=Streptomyces sp. SAI-229 TaxID=3377731 RepID=UPI003C7E82CE